MGTASMKMPIKLYNGVRLLDRPSYRNVWRLDCGAMPMILAFQRKGLLVDVEHMKRLGVHYEQEMERITEEVRDLVGRHVDLSSADQVCWMLFEYLELSPTGVKMTKKGKRYQVDEKNLMLVRDQAPELIDLLLDYREFEKLLGTYIGGILKFTNKSTSRLHPNIKHCSTETGRLATEDPNLLAIPSRSEEGQRLRAGFIAPPGKKIVAIDYSQIEIRVQAHLGNVRAMIETYERDGDIHTETTARMFRIAIEAVSKTQRRTGKTTSLGVMYDISPEGLLWQFVKEGLGHLYTLADCEEFIRLYFQAYPEILDYRKEQFKRMRMYGYVWDLTGRIRHIPEVKSVHKWIQGAGMRAGSNMPVQSFAQAIIKLAMAAVQDTIDEMQLEGQVDPLLQTHDELTFEVDEVIAEDVKEVFGGIMDGIVPDGVLRVPIRSSGAIGSNLAECK